jgi:hypothetical protein
MLHHTDGKGMVSHKAQHLAMLNLTVLYGQIFKKWSSLHLQVGIGEKFVYE